MTHGEGLMRQGLSTLKTYVDAQSDIVRRYLAGEITEMFDLVDMAFAHKNIPRSVDGYEIDLYRPGRVCTYIPKGAPYPRISPEVSDYYFLRPKKMGGMSEVYLEDIVGKPEAIIEMKTSERLTTLQTDFRLARLERAMLALDAAVTSAGSTYIVDCKKSTNETDDFSVAFLQDMIQKRKQNWPVSDMRELFIIIPSDVENQLRKDSAFDNAPDVKEELLRLGALPKTLMGLSAVFVTDQMPVLYDSGGNMQDVAAAPTGVPKLPIQFTSAANKQYLPPWLQEGWVDVANFTEDYVARSVYLIERNKAGIYLTQDLPPEFPPVQLNIKDESYDSIGMKIRGLMNFGVPVDAGEVGVKYVVRADNIRLRWVS